MRNYKALLMAAATAALPLLPQSATAQEYGGPERLGSRCDVMTSEECLVATYNNAAWFAVNQMSILYNRDDFVPKDNLDILDKNNMSLHWQACQPIRGVSPLAPPENHLSAPAYCLTSVQDFAEKFGGDYDKAATDAWLAHIDDVRTAITESGFHPYAPEKPLRPAPAEPLPDNGPKRFQL